MGPILTILFSIILLLANAAYSQERVSVNINEDDKSPELTICTQNLMNYGAYKSVARRIRGFTEDDLIDKEQGLITRFLEARCDVIAVQELLGGTEKTAQKALNELAKLLKERTNRPFLAIAGPSNDKVARVGYLVALDRAKFLQKLSYSRVQLPKIAEEQKTRYFARGPLEIELVVAPRNKVTGKEKRIILITFHFKSRAFNNEDPAGLEWETYRMEMAEALRRIVLSRHGQDFGRAEKIVVLLGDRNSHSDVASAGLLSGALELKDFQGEAPCRLSKRGLPLCKHGTSNGQEFFSVLTTDPETRQLPGTYRFGTTFSWLDDILLPQRLLAFARADEGVEGNYDSGVIYDPPTASDHGLAYVRINW